MTDNKSNIPPEEDFFKNAKIPFSKSKDDVWENMMKQIEEKPKQEPKVIQFNWSRFAAAASVILLIGSGLFCKMYSVTVNTANGEYASHTLPDGSIIDMNVASSINYAPLWWFVSRELNFEGEAFFSVQKGSNFAVISHKGTTEVLGTSFNISTRNKQYEVYCETGKVRVSNNYGEQKAVLTPGMSVNLGTEKGAEKEASKGRILAWKDRKFHFENQSLGKVFSELELHYDVKIICTNSIAEKAYTGHFKKPETIKEALDLISTTFGFTFALSNEKTYTISH